MARAKRETVDEDEARVRKIRETIGANMTALIDLEITRRLPSHAGDYERAAARLEIAVNVSPHLTAASARDFLRRWCRGESMPRIHDRALTAFCRVVHCSLSDVVNGL